MQTLELGPMEILRPSFLAVDLEFLSQIFGRKIGGVLGYDVLARSVAELDLAEVTLNLHPAGHEPTDVEVWTDLLFLRNIPTLTCDSSLGRALYGLDTGAQGTIAFALEAARVMGLQRGEDAEEGESQGAGGSTSTYQVFLDWFEIGPKRYEDLPAGVVEALQGALSEGTMAGLIGVQVLKDFRIVLDYPTRRIAFVERSR